MIPAQGNGWQYLRGVCLDVIPPGTGVYYTRAMPLYVWRQRGAFRVGSCDRHTIVIEAAAAEVGTALLSDAEYLLDHAAEQHATVRSLLEHPTWHSPAWAVVTIYYWSFFAAMAMTRLAGATVWFLDRTAITQLRTLAGGRTQTQPPAGALSLNVVPYISATEREIVLQPTKTQLHDALWNSFHHLIKLIFDSADQDANALEYRLFWCFSEASKRLGNGWPSLVRNVVNYRPGRAYREVIRETEIDLSRYLRRIAPFTFEKLVSELENAVLRTTLATLDDDAVPLLCRLLLLFATAVGAIAREVHTEIIERNSADRRWLDLKYHFLERYCHAAGGGVWPLGD